MRAFEEASRRMQLPAGGSVASAWESMLAVFGIPLWCVLVQGQPRETAEGIRTVLELPEDVVMLGVEGMLRNGSELTAFVGGHAITLKEWRDGRVVFHDPLPGGPFLAGAVAEGEHYWSVAAKDLGSVLTGLLVLPVAWLEAFGETAAVRFAELPGTQFWSFFGVTETGREESEFGGVEVHAEPGNFAEHVELSFTVGRGDRVTHAALSMSREWVTGGGANPLALDITRNFVAAVLPPRDVPAAAPILAGFDPAGLGGLWRTAEFQESIAGDVLLVYLGEHPEIAVTFGLSELRLDESEGWLTVEVAIF